MKKEHNFQNESKKNNREWFRKIKCTYLNTQQIYAELIVSYIFKLRTAWVLVYSIYNKWMGQVALQHIENTSH